MNPLLPGSTPVQMSVDQIVTLGASNSFFFSRFFFPKTVRQESPAMHKSMWADLEGPHRYVSFMVFRGGAKTSIIRIFAAKLISYTLARTILFVGKSQDAAKRSVEWLMHRVEEGGKWAQVYGLRQGNKWTSEEIEIYHGTDEVPIRVIALGIGGSTRGINVEDYRPDIIVVDDPCDEENTATVEQREKIADSLFGALQNSLAPESESPHAKLILAQTLLHSEDLISKTAKDPLWKTSIYSCFDENGESRWPQRYPTPTLLREKEGFVARGKLYLWMREMECKIVSSTLASFRSSLLQFYDMLPKGLTTFMAIDPVPPPSEREEAMNFRDKDYEALAVVGYKRIMGEDRYYVCATVKNRGHEPDWTIAKFFELAADWNPLKVKVESVAYQRTLKWLIEQAMIVRRTYIPVDAHLPEKRKKSYRIIDTIGSILAVRGLYIHPSMSDIIEQITDYPNVAYDDVIEAVAVALAAAMQFAGGGLDLGEDEGEEELEGDVRTLKPLSLQGACP